MAATHPNSSDPIPIRICGKSYTTPLPLFPIYSHEEQRVVHSAYSADVNAAQDACNSAWTAFQSWKKESAVFRRRLLQRYAALLRDHEEDLVAAQRLETSVNEQWARKNVHLAADLIEETAACITRLVGEIPQTQTPGSLALTFATPVGPILSIAPWNSSVILGARSLAVPVAAGCSVVFKASELCPKTHHLLVTIFEEAGLPLGVINVLQTRREDAPAVTEALIAHTRIRKIEFIGSASIGRIIGQLGGKYLKPVLMELGGKGPVIVLDDANLEDAADKCIAGAFLHHGQLCFSTERVIVIESVAEKFKELLKQKAPHFQTGNSVSSRIMESSLAKLEDAQKKGAKFLVGGPEKASVAALKPTILTDLTPDMEIFDDEAFGPSFSLYVVRNDQEAIEIANSTQYGLNAAVHSTIGDHALEVAMQLETGQTHINSMTAHDEPTLPVGGVKGSGWGRANSLWGLREFTELKLVTLSKHGNAFV